MVVGGGVLAGMGGAVGIILALLGDGGLASVGHYHIVREISGCNRYLESW